MYSKCVYPTFMISDHKRFHAFILRMGWDQCPKVSAFIGDKFHLKSWHHELLRRSIVKSTHPSAKHLINCCIVVYSYIYITYLLMLLTAWNLWDKTKIFLVQG